MGKIITAYSLVQTLKERNRFGDVAEDPDDSKTFHFILSAGMYAGVK
jgi:hypothetical protein